MIFKNLFFTIATVSLLFSAGGCNSRSNNNAAVADVPTFKDDLGRNVSINPANVKRVVILTPALTETIYALGYGDRVVGVSGYSNYPAEATKQPNIGGPDEKQMNYEQIIALKPDLVLADGGFQKGAIESLSKLGITVYAFEVDKISGVGQMMRAISKLLGETDASRKVTDSFEAEEKKRQVNRYPQKPSVFYLFGDPLYTAGGTSFTNELIERAGGINLFRDVDKKSFMASEEELIKRNPDVIVLPRMGDPEKQKAEILARPNWKTLNAVIHKRIILLDEDTSSRPGPRILEAVRELENALHPQAKTP